MDKDNLHADYVLDTASRKLSFLYVNPINAVVEMDKCFADPTCNPTFRYRKIRFSLELMERKLRKLHTGGGSEGKLLDFLREHNIDKTKMLKYIGDPKFTKYSIRVYGKPSKSLLRKARGLLELEMEPLKRNLNSDKFVPMLKAGLERYQLDDWKIKLVKGLSSTAYVNISDKTVMLRRGEKLSDKYVRRLVVHEIGTHVLRAVNGAQQKLKVFSTGFPMYMATEEGLAVMNEHLAGLLDNRTLKNYAARAIAVGMALEQPFSEIYTFLLKYFPRETAYRIAVRVKRGLVDTSQPGGCTKDYNYLAGYYDVKRYFKKHSRIDKLYYGKVSLELLNLLEGMELVEPSVLPRY
ncbi:flavohemoglobin expression-modulating QEGLA motif protein [Candidatus Woesearchaeota archaeon]|nr:flavohemoglobin expression-modulating QEGLA motif protein [Candidatus Woesearchaeota archaeon]